MLYDMVTVMVTSYVVSREDVEGSGKIMLYSMFNMCWS